MKVYLLHDFICQDLIRPGDKTLSDPWLFHASVILIVGLRVYRRMNTSKNHIITIRTFVF